MLESVIIGDDNKRADAHIGFLLLVRRSECFLFGHGPMTPTLLDVLILTGLNISASDRSYDLLSKATSKFPTRNIGGWKGYIGKNAKTGPVSIREHTVFLNMWLEKFIFCGKTVGPTTNTLKMVEILTA